VRIAIVHRMRAPDSACEFSVRFRIAFGSAEDQFLLLRLACVAAGGFLVAWCALALCAAAASARWAVGEAITNLCAAPRIPLGPVKLSANWMAACGHDGEDARL